MHKLADHIAAISTLCSIHGVKHLYAFGSVLSDDFNGKSDIDFLVDFFPINNAEYADNYFDFKFALEALLKRKIDLLEEKAQKNPYFLKAIENRKQLIYGN